ncbi:flavin-containing monooxygenase FMO GS-OX5 isoform X1 [Cajanus cajan]|uniref:flavin-containing monooxygenase FMO GS-OX5 isoform X1 n=2 Tax=Cajanus cajan TaxID=3821 RepID=UPI00098DA679|nr:flavin-containing monooxygenase FMO GS-OX5 isoform X1 [Cajanus cajan]
MPHPLRVAVIGAGVAGLAAARELRGEGLNVVVFEKSDHLGGMWRYDPRTDSDPVGWDPSREVVHTSLYRSLRTNLPRQLMGFLDYPLPNREGGDTRTFPGHEEVFWFLNRFADEFALRGLIRFGSEVVRVERVGDSWVVESRTRDSFTREDFQAVVLCTGHFTEPRLPTIPGIEKWPGYQIHSHNYRVPEPFRGQVVIVIGFAASAFDISRDIAKVAKEVHIATRSPDVKVMKLANHSNIWLHKMVKCVSEDSLVAFDDGSSVYADTIFYCTGYKYHYPFLETNGIITIEDNRVGPLYKHVFPPALAPWLSFIGIPEKDVIFQMTELQCKWVARVLSGKVLLPTEKEMMAYVEEYYQQMEKNGFPKHVTHHLHFKEIDYCNWLAARAGLPPIEEWREEMYLESIKSIFGMQDNYRDQWDDAHQNAMIKDASLPQNVV